MKNVVNESTNFSQKSPFCHSAKSLNSTVRLTSNFDCASFVLLYKTLCLIYYYQVALLSFFTHLTLSSCPMHAYQETIWSFAHTEDSLSYPYTLLTLSSYYKRAYWRLPLLTLYSLEIIIISQARLVETFHALLPSYSLDIIIITSTLTGDSLY
jgi:hypothetical protein